jgi:L-lactate dehydrogenase complex protein LldG
MSKADILGGIRRGLKRGVLPADQQAMLEGRLASHPRHLIPARSQLPRPEQIAQNVKAGSWELSAADLAEIDAITR